MIIKPTQGPTCPQTSRSILNWLMDKALPADDGSQQFVGRLPHEAVEKLVKVINSVHGAERSEFPIDGGTLKNYNFIIVHTIKGRFEVSIFKPDTRQVGDKYQVRFNYQILSLDELLEMRGMK